nr:MAG TPA_asm: hypothetical protein [Caudoviricetes sp.]
MTFACASADTLRYTVSCGMEMIASMSGRSGMDTLSVR